VLQERWLPWKAGLYGSEVVSPQERCFQTDGLVYDKSRVMNVGEESGRETRDPKEY